MIQSLEKKTHEHYAGEFPPAEGKLGEYTHDGFHYSVSHELDWKGKPAFVNIEVNATTPVPGDEREGYAGNGTLVLSDGIVDHLAVQPGYRGRGVAGHIIQTFEGHLKQAGFKESKIAMGDEPWFGDKEATQTFLRGAGYTPTESVYHTAVGPGRIWVKPLRTTKSFLGRLFSIIKELSPDSVQLLSDTFGPEALALDPDTQSMLWGLIDRTGKIGDFVSYSVLNMNEAEKEIAQGGDYMVWITAADELTCDFCAPLDGKIVSADDVLGMGIPPAHVNCRCELVTVEEQYGELKPVVYYYQLPFDYDEWKATGKIPYMLGEDERVWLAQRVMNVLKHLFDYRTGLPVAPHEHGHVTAGAGVLSDPETRVKNTILGEMPDGEKNVIHNVLLVTEEGKNFDAGGQHFKEGGEFNLKSKDISLFHINDQYSRDPGGVTDLVQHEGAHAMWNDIQDKWDGVNERYNNKEDEITADMKSKGYPEFGKPSYLIEQGKTSVESPSGRRHFSDFDPEKYNEDPQYGDRSINDYMENVLAPERSTELEKIGQQDVLAFQEATKKEGGVTEYSKAWLREGGMVGYNENFAECTAQTIRSPRYMATAYPKTYKAWKRIVKRYGWGKKGFEI